MKTHILIALLAVLASACASNRDVASTQEKDYFDDREHAMMIDGAASRIR